MGIAVLLIAIILLIVCKATMHLWVKPDFNDAAQKALAAKWEAHKNKVVPISERITTTESIATPQLFAFDPNTVSPAQLKQLGLSEKTISIFLNWRNKGKHFYKKEDFKALYTLDEADYNRLAPYITIKINRISLNTADSASLVALPGIGPKLAHKILEYKKEIGSYTSIEQLKDVYHFSDTTFNTLKDRLTTE